ncbi:MAG: tyrosine--tRNA ligase [Candidatus Pacebacteria bacterium]|jgi:tyrosyl-tRNA synthetase|nr:tyrosine--tRNA ligase [Parcubacteria group bacterium]MDP6249495.1 tyrosine--tRNA ligase [Candidatus Paceibacterota bacterium]MDP7159209.1 tyrosine--tRNA ligase [Candidatus Paceibacterota bacterium]MDP7367900.1 tyrosine--tRNA ligase [Candidatus Paceibacterota bacterium]MDP7466315.1 tyrosine--tRNA ligase [Candidatus Paceibacterota bacterium]|tara:strand:+ start:12289 stop:13509 length:1221 start_codon:yes stop_codon:yes gene_type:complete
MFWNSKNDTKTSNPESINDFLDKGVENIYPSREFVESKLKSGEKLTMYLGIDPTGPTLHLGHAIVLKKLREFQELGHKVILLIGDFTAMVGDPTDKTAMRKKLSRQEALENAKLYKKQASIFLNFSGENYAEIKHNSEWLSKMTFEEVLDLASNMTVEQMLKRDMFEERKKQDKPIYIHEFLYPLMQGYDSVMMEVDGEIGGNDQTFNMLAGRTLMKQMLGKEKFVITTKLLEDNLGAKMGKTEGNMIKLTDSANEMFGKVMSWTDKMTTPGFELATNVPSNETAQIKTELESGANPKDIKARLAGEIVSIYHGKNSAQKAKENFENTFASGGVSEDAQEVTVAKGTPLYDVVSGLVESKTELRRLVESGAVSEMDGNKITDINFKIGKDTTLKIGKRRFLKIKVK